ncbi:MAG: hypothetical protein HOA61_07615 [Bacteroidetes bacterium]|jgi:hypothetical protein|nr:hypothetical protein [Bacteroidota bacterium]MBT6835897.1 hypothetical protein [Bacteroidota bacterium]MBT7826338.1 hypothetical protein [Bacteroidota bacterium]
MGNRKKEIISRYVKYLIGLWLLNLMLYRLGSYILLPHSMIDSEVISFLIDIGWTIIICNLIMAIIIFRKMKKTNTLNWWILVVTIINKEVGAIFFLMYINESDIIQE